MVLTGAEIPDISGKVAKEYGIKEKTLMKAYDNQFQ